MSQYRNIRRAGTRQDLDRGTWADVAQLVLFRDIIGSGETVINIPEFGMVFDRPPFFSYGVELQEGEVLTACDYPFVSCGVYEWVTNEPERGQPVYYYGANLWIRIVCRCELKYRFQLSFEAVTFKNVEHL